MLEKQFSCLVGKIHDAALDHRLWPEILQEVCDFVGASAANLYSQDITSTRVTLHHAYGEDPHYVQLYFDKYMKMNPLYPALTFFSVGEVHSQSDIIPYEEFHETRFYKEWVRPQGIVDVLFANLERSATGSATLSIRRYERDGFVDDEARRRMSLLIPHVRRAVLIGDVLGLRICDATTLTDALDGLAAGIFLVDAYGRMVHANTSGRAMLDESICLRNIDGRLTACDLTADQMLRDAFAAASNGDAVLGARGVAVSMPVVAERWCVAHVLPLNAGARRRALNHYAAVAAVFVRNANLGNASAAELLAKAYGLTAMELRVLLGIVHVGGGPMVAKDLGISETTVRSHLKHVFEKTGTNRQADLVRLAAGFESRLVKPYEVKPVHPQVAGSA